MYEAFNVVLAAAILGVIVGYITALSIATQIYMFIELPTEVAFPTLLLFFMMVIACVTTWFAVWIPVK